MKVGKVRSALEGLDDDAEVVLWINNDENISQFEEPSFKLDHVGKSTEGVPRLDVFVSAFDADELDEGEEEDELDGD
jgi:hypothetical protein